MRAVLFSFLSILAVLPAQSLPAGIDTVGRDKQDHLAFERYFVETVMPPFPSGACSHNVTMHRALNAAQSSCSQEHARHSNGRCYRVVDKAQNGDTEGSNKYRITYRADCFQTWELNASELKPSQTLDFCDEDGGCIEGLNFNDEEGRSVAVSRTCTYGMLPDTNGICRRVLGGSRRSIRSLPENTTQGGGLFSGVYVHVCDNGYVLDSKMICRRVLVDSNDSNGSPIESTTQFVTNTTVIGTEVELSEQMKPREKQARRLFIRKLSAVSNRCKAGYITDANGICIKVKLQ